MKNMEFNFNSLKSKIRISRIPPNFFLKGGSYLINLDIKKALKSIPDNSLDLIVSSPPYNLGKEYEKKTSVDNYLKLYEQIFPIFYKKLKDTGSICWEVGYSNILGKTSKDSEFVPLEYYFHPIFNRNNFRMKNRIIWSFGHGVNNKNNFSYRHESIMWYVKSSKYKFNLDDVRVRQKYPGKVGYKKQNKDKYKNVTSTKGGKNPEDVWKDWYKSQINSNLLNQNQLNEIQGNIYDIPNVKSHHVEKINHPCQFPVGLIARLVLALTDKGDNVLDPFCGAGSTGVACAISGRNFIGVDTNLDYLNGASERINEALNEDYTRIRPDKPVSDHTKSPLYYQFDWDKWDLKNETNKS